MKTKYKLTLFLVAIIALAASVKVYTNGEKNYANVNLRSMPNEAYGLGERLEYKVGYKFITAGYGTFYVKPQTVNVNGRPCYDINFDVKSLPELEMLYKVKDSYRSLVDISTLAPWGFEQRIREQKYRKDYRAMFDQVENKAYANGKTFPITEYMHDIVSAFYYVRTLDLSKMKKNDVIYLRNFFDDTTNTLGVKYLGKQEVTVEAGKFRCHVIEPIVQKGGLFKNEGKIFIWITDDDRKIAVKVGTQIIIGFVGAELTSYSGLRGPLKAKIG